MYPVFKSFEAKNKAFLFRQKQLTLLFQILPIDLLKNIRKAEVFRSSRHEVSFKIAALVQSSYFMKSYSTTGVFLEIFQ